MRRYARFAVLSPILFMLLAACETPLAPDAGAPQFSDAASTAPAAPSGLTGTASPPTGIDLVWVDESDDELYFQLQRRIDFGGAWGVWATVHQPAADATGLSDTGLAEDTRYQYRIRACNAAGCSAYSGSRWLSTATVPAVPASLAGTPTEEMTAIDLVWTAAGSNHAGFSIQRRLQEDGVWGPYATVATPAGAAEDYRDEGLTQAVRYQYRIRACNSAGCSAYRTGDWIATMYPPEMHVNHSAHLAWPVPDSVFVRWDTGGGTEAQLQRRVKTDDVWGTWSTIAFLPMDENVAVSAYYDKDIVSGSSYRYRVRACNLWGCSPYLTSNSVTVP
jgi:hypothetical protein